MNFKDEIGLRIRKVRTERKLTLSDVEQKTGDMLSLKRINAYENGDRMPGPAEAVILAKALGVRPAYILAVDDIQLPITPQEEALVKNWRKLAERDRMRFFRSIETEAMQAADPAQDQQVAKHLPAAPKRKKPA